MLTDELGPGTAWLHYDSELDGTRQSFCVYRPWRWRARYPVLVLLHGFGGRAAEPPPVACGWADALGWLLVVPDGRGNQNWDGVGEDDVLRALERVGELVRLDAERIYLHGGSMGGHGALRLALRHPHRFAAVSAVAGWLSAEQFYPKWYAAQGEWDPHPAIAHLVDAAAPAAWRAHARWVPGRLAYGSADGVNEPEDTEWFIAWLRQQRLYGRGGWEALRVDGGGHGAGGDWAATFRFLRGRRRQWPRALVSPTLRHADLGWVRAEWRPDPLAPVRCELNWGRGWANVQTDNCGALAIQPGLGPRELGRRVRLRVNGEDLGTVPGDEPTAVPLQSPPGPLHKRRSEDGPLAEFFREPFQVLAPATGEDRAAAERFCADWAAWLVPDGGSRLRVQRPEEAVEGRRWMLFGTSETNPSVRRVTGGVRVLADGLVLGERVLRGARLGWWALAPRADGPLALVCHGYQQSGIPADGPVGKDLERLPWQWPDWVVWDQGVECRLTVQPPLRQLADAWVAAGTFGADWGANEE